MYNLSINSFVAEIDSILTKRAIYFGFIHKWTRKENVPILFKVLGRVDIEKIL